MGIRHLNRARAPGGCSARAVSNFSELKHRTEATTKLLGEDAIGIRSVMNSRDLTEPTSEPSSICAVCIDNSIELSFRPRRPAFWLLTPSHTARLRRRP